VRGPAALILSGGKGTRLRPLTLGTPKPLLPLVNAPSLGFPLALLRKHGCRDAVLCVSDELAPYRPFVSAQKKLGTSVLCSRETRELGTAGAMKNAERLAQGETLFAFNGDILTDLDLTAMLRFHRERRARITIALVPVPDPKHYGLVRTGPRGRVRAFIEKPPSGRSASAKGVLINGGIYLMDRAVLDRVPAGRNSSVERELFPGCVRDGLPVFGYAVPRGTYWLDIGTPEKYLQANLDVLSGRLKKIVPAGSLRRISPSASIHPLARVGPDAVVGPFCRVGAGAEVRRSVLLRRVTAGKDSVVEGAMIGPGSVLGDAVRVRPFTVLGPRSRVTAFSRV